MDFVVLSQVAVLAVAASAISATISRAKVFASTRRCIALHNRWLGELVSCHYCMVHWVCAGFTVIYRPVIMQVFFPIDLFVSLFVMVGFAAIISGVIVCLTFTGGDAKTNRKYRGKAENRYRPALAVRR